MKKATTKNQFLIIAIAVLLFLIGTIGFVDYFFSSKANLKGAKTQLENIINKKEYRALKLLESNTFIKNSNNYQYLYDIGNRYNKENIALFVFKNDNLWYWSSNEISIKNASYYKEENLQFFKTGNGYYLNIFRNINDSIDALMAIPIYYNYPIENKYLHSGYAFKKNIFKKIGLTFKKDKGTLPIYTSNNTYLFSIVADNTSKGYVNTFLQILEILLIILLIIYLTQWIRLLFRERHTKQALLILFLSVVFIECLFNQFPIFSFTQNSTLFSETLYSSKFYGHSLGTLLIHLLLIVWSFSFIRNIEANWIKKTNKNNLIIIFPIILYYIQLLVISNIVHNSTINFNFYQYNTLDVFTYVGLFVIGLTFIIVIQILNWIFSIERKQNIIYYTILFNVIIAFIFYYFNEFSSLKFAGFTVLWNITFIFIFYLKNEISEKYYFISSLIMIAFISVFTTVLIVNNSNEKEFNIRKHQLRALNTERDYGEEFELAEIEQELLNDNFIIKYFQNPYIFNFDLENRVERYFKSFSKIYLINVYAFDMQNNPIKGAVIKSNEYFNKLINNKNTDTISSNMYYVPLKETGEKYIGKYEIIADSTLVGNLFVEFIPRILNTYSAYPELLMNDKKYYDEEFENFSYAIYSKNKLIKQSGDYEYSLVYNFEDKHTTEYIRDIKNNYIHSINFNDNKVVVISEPIKSLWITFAIFSFIFLFILILLLLIDFLGLSYHLWIDTAIKDFFINNTLQKQIQNAMLFLLILALIFIGIISFVYFNNQFKNHYNQKLTGNIIVVTKNFKQLFNEYYPTYGNNTYDWVLNNRLKQRSDIFGIDINAYNAQGDLMASSQPEIFKTKLLSNKINEDAFYNLNYLYKSRYIQDEHIANLDYVSAYTAISVDGKTLAYLQFPYYSRDKNFRAEISYFLVSLINVLVILLIISSVAAVFLSRSITNSLSIIADKLQQVRLNKKNVPLEWNRDDEIGLLVKQYNLMLAELEKSAKLLSRTEREGAWREMAKQVAHEIKNPLTPMKLSIQHLQRALLDDSDDVKALTKKVSQRLIEQIDNLTDIASAFSDFAKMPKAEKEKIDLLPAIISTADLFSETENITINLQLPTKPCYALGDNNQWLRVCTNIIKNAIQAIPENENGIITITLIEKEDNYLLSIEDNGKGIEQHQVEKIFEPNFTTKSSGTGLGLAICKNIIERMDGRIWFETQVDNYTIFYISIPKINE
ncbi:MAG: HAMP domain-containing sensor histidine kinase [Chitinophagales bacterium]